MIRPLLLALAAVSASALGQSSSPPVPLIVGKAELLNTIRSADLKPGDAIFVRTIGPWQQGDCTVASHTTLTATVATSTSSPSGRHHSVLALLFSPIRCAGPHPTLMRPALVALEAPSDAVRTEIERYGSGAAQKNTLAGLFPSGYGDVRSSNSPITNGSADSGLSPSMMNALREAPVPDKPLRTGEVRGYRGIDLNLPENTKIPISILASSHKFSLDRETEFALAYLPVASEPAPAAPSAVVKAPPPPQPKDEIADVCASPGCTELVATPDISSAHALWTLPLVKLGYQPRPQREVVGLDHSASIYFFGEDQLLLTFTRHTLVPRPNEQIPGSNPRNVRGVLISRADGRVIRIKDWIVSDDLGPFVWPLDDHRVLAQVGHDLVLFGPDLSIQRRFPLSGPLLFLSAAPHGDLLLVATVHEKHTPQEHAKIAAFLGPGSPVDEEYDLTGLNAALQVTGSKRVSVEPTRPALLKNTMVSARPVHGMEWVLERSTWDGASKPLARFRSTCEVQVRSLPGDLLLAQGCPPIDPFNALWYRVLNLQGAVLLKGAVPKGDFLQQAESSSDGKLFAVACSHFDHAVEPTTLMHAGDFANLTVTLYSTRNGKEIFAARLPQGSAQQDTFSISPSNSSLAVLTSATLQAFALTPPAEPSPPGASAGTSARATSPK
jgi:hypothetical protein